MMKKIYESPLAENIAIDEASFLEASGEIIVADPGEALGADVFSGFGKKF